MITIPVQKVTRTWHEQFSFKKWINSSFRFYTRKRDYRLDIRKNFKAPAAVHPEAKLYILNPDVESLFIKPGMSVRGYPASEYEALTAIIDGYSAHEAGHVRFTHFAAWPKDKRLARMTNILEDERMERLMVRCYPDLAMNFTLLGDLHSEHSRLGLPTRAKDAGKTHKGFTGRLWEGCLIWRWLHDRPEFTWTPKKPDLWAQIRPLVEASWVAKNTDEVVEYARQILELIPVTERKPRNLPDVSMSGADADVRDGSKPRPPAKPQVKPPEPEEPDAEKAEPDDADTEKADQDEQDIGKTSESDTAESDSDEEESSGSDSGEGGSGEGDSEESDSEEGGSGEGDSEEGDSEEGDSEEGDSEEGDSEERDSEEGDSEEGDSEEGDSEEGDSEEGDSSGDASDNSDSDDAEASGSEPSSDDSGEGDSDDAQDDRTPGTGSQQESTSDEDSSGSGGESSAEGDGDEGDGSEDEDEDEDDEDDGIPDTHKAASQAAQNDPDAQAEDQQAQTASAAATNPGKPGSGGERPAPPAMNTVVQPRIAEGVEGLARDIAPLLKPQTAPGSPQPHRNKGRLNMNSYLQGRERVFRRMQDTGREQDVHLRLVLDDSGSMAYNGCDLEARKAALMLARATSLASSSFEMMLFEEKRHVKNYHWLTRPGETFDEISDRLSRLPRANGGSTFLSSALEFAVTQPIPDFQKGVVVIVTDGQLDFADLQACTVLHRRHPHLLFIPVLIGDASVESEAYHQAFGSAVVVKDVEALSRTLKALLGRLRAGLTG